MFWIKKVEPSFLDDVTGSIFLDPCMANFDGTGRKLHYLDLDLWFWAHFRNPQILFFRLTPKANFAVFSSCRPLGRLIWNHYTYASFCIWPWPLTSKIDLRSKILCALESSHKDLSFDTSFVSVAPLFTELDRGAKNAPRAAVVEITPGPGRVNPRPAGGGQILPPSWIFSITPKPLQLPTQNLVYLILHQFDI